MDESMLRTVKVDRDTHRLIGDLAHVLGRTRGAVVRDAIHSYASWRERRLDEGLDAAAARIAGGGAEHEQKVASGALDPVEDERVERSRIGAAKTSPRVLARMSPAERLELHRAELDAAFAPYGARVKHMASDARDYGYPPGANVIVVELDEGPRFEQLSLAGAAFTVLAVVCAVVTEDWWRP